MTEYPNKIDSDAELPRVDDNLSETSVETINALREAVIAIEKTIGENPQGVTSTLVQRLSVFLNDDGTAKASALVAAGLVALPITNSMIASNAGILESKLDLDVATQVLQDEINSNDIDITQLQQTLTALLAAYANHINGIADKHDGYGILLDKNYPSSTPPWLINITATDVSRAIAAINNNFYNHIGLSKVGAHPASAITVDTSALQTVTSTNLQGAIEQLDESRIVELIDHRDDMHANGLSLWANSSDGYTQNNQIIPQTVGSTVTALIIPGIVNIIDFSPLTMSSFPIKQSDSVVVLDTAAIGVYTINDIGPRSAEGTKPSLTANQLEIVGTFPSDGYVTAQVFGSSSTILLKGNLAATIHQSDLKVDSIQVSRPNAARVVSLGLNAKFLDATSTLEIEAGVSSTLSRTLLLTGLHKDRNGVVANPPTIDSLVERINSIIQNRADGYAFPVTAYRVGDEFMLSHNWIDDFAYIKVKSTGTANFFLGFNSAGANVVDRYVYPTANAYYYVNGVKLHDVARITQRTADISGQYFSFTGFNPISAGIKIGHLLHLKTHANTNEIGTYFITDLTTSTIKIHKNAGITTQTGVSVEIYHDALPLDDFNTNIKDMVIETFITSNGTLGYNERLNYEDNISNLRIVDVSDNFVASTYTLTSGISGGIVTLAFTSTYAKTVQIPTTFTGKVKIPTPHLIEYVTADITAPIGSGSSVFTFSDHINEEEVLEICSVRLDGLLTLSNIVDKRMFGTLGLDELREDVVQTYIETPTKELRSNGVIEGLDVVDGYYQDPNFPLTTNFYGILVRGGTAVVDGVRVSVPITPIMFPNTAGTFIIGLDKLGAYQLFNTAQYSMADLLDGYAGEVTLVAQIDHDGATTLEATLLDLRFNISKIDDRVELLFDETNHFIGHFSTFATALKYINNYPKNEKFKVRVVSHGGGDLNIISVSHSLTVVIDGQVNNITVSGPCKITSESISLRSEPHIRGTLTVNAGCTSLEVSNLAISNGGGQSTINVGTAGSSYIFKNIVFNGNSATGQLNISGTSLADKVVLDSCLFRSGSAFRTSAGSIVVDNFIVNNCEIYGISTGSKVDVAANNMVVSNTVFDNCGINQTLVSNPVIIDNCVFRNMTVVSGGQRVINSLATVVISNTKFNNIVASTDDAITSSISSDGYTRLYLDHCMFDTCTSTVGNRLITTRGSVTNSIFKSITSPGSPGDIAIECLDFNNNVIVNSTNEFAVGAVRIVNNDGLNVVKSGSFASIELVEGNIFAASSVFGYNIDLASNSGVKILSNVFGLGPQTAIQVLSGIGELVISNNKFLHTGYCLNVNIAPVNLIFNANIVKSPLLLLGPGTTEGAMNFSDNIFKNSSGFTISGTNDNTIFDSNIFQTGDLTINGSVIAGLMVVNNIFNGALTLSADLSGSSISGNLLNAGTITFNGNLSNTLVTNNADSSSTTLAFAAISVASTLITNNTISFSGLSNAVLFDTMITDNIISGSDITLNIDPSSSASDYARVVFSNNILGNDIDVTLTSSGAIRGTIIDGNIASSSTHPTYPSITISSVINESVIANNFNFSITVSSGANSCVIVNNIALNSDIIISGACNSNIVSGNYLANLGFDGSSASGIIFSNMFINGDAAIAAIAGTADKISFINNVTTGSIVFSSISGLFTRLSFNNNIVGAGIVFNISGSDISVVGNIALSYLRVWSTSSSDLTISKMNISNNTITSGLQVCDTLFSNTSSFTNSKISGNVIGSNLDLMPAVIGGATLDFSNNIISDNFIEDNINIFVSGADRGDITFSDNSFLNNRITDDFVFNSGTLPAADTLIEKTIISGNSLDTFVFGENLTYSELVLTSNRITNTLSAIFFALNPVNTPGTFESLNISNNIINSRVQFTVAKASSTIIDRFIFNNNTMYNNDLRIRYSGTNALSLTLRGWIVSGNVMRAIALRTDEGGSGASSMNIQASSFNNNAFSGDSAATAGLLYEPGVYIAKGSKTGGILINGLSINGNFYGGDTTSIQDTQIKFSTALSASINISNSDFSSNRNIDIIYSATSTGLYAMSFVNMSNNIFAHDTATAEGILFSPSSTSSTWSQIAIQSNKGGAITVSNISSLMGLVIANNFMDWDFNSEGGDGDISIGCTTFRAISIVGCSARSISVAVTSGTSEGLIINSCQCTAIDVDGNTASISELGINGNRVVPSGASTGGTVTIHDLNNLYGAIVNSNQVDDSISLTTINELTNAVIISNVLRDVIGFVQRINITSISERISSLIISNNSCDGSIRFVTCSVSISGADDISIMGNYCGGLDLSGFSGAGVIQRMIVSSNTVDGTLTLPVLATFDTNADQSKFISNYADTWSSSSAFTTTGATNIFPWGNTSLNASTNVTFNGSTATNTATANNVTTGGGGGITC